MRVLHFKQDTTRTVGEPMEESHKGTFISKLPTLLKDNISFTMYITHAILGVN